MSVINLLFQALPNWLKNRYVLTMLFFVLWLLFFDSNTLVSQLRLRRQIHEMKTRQTFYRTEIQKSNAELKELLTNNATLEKFAREHYLMKRPNEDVFIIVEE